MKKRFAFGILLAILAIAGLSYAVYVFDVPKPENSGLLYYTPTQCNQNPWDKWYGEGNIQFFVEPTEQQLLTAYYSNVYQIQILSYESKKVSDITCLACNCPRGDIIIAKVNPADVQKMLGLGWKAYPG